MSNEKPSDIAESEKPIGHPKKLLVKRNNEQSFGLYPLLFG